MNSEIIKKDRRVLDWTLVKTPFDYLSVGVATFFGSAFLPKAPGTWGSLFAIPLVYEVSSWSLELKILFWLAVLGVGTIASRRFEKLSGIADNQYIVIDEVLGMGITALMLDDPTLMQLGLVFVLFRLFDIIKIWPVNIMDSWSHQISKKTGNLWYSAFGVMADDLLAGIQAFVVLSILMRYFLN